MLVCVGAIGACDVSYKFPEDNAGVVSRKLSVSLIWWNIEPRRNDVYLSHATGTGCNSGYFGAQFHADGTQSLLYSMWDAPKYTNNSNFKFQGLPASRNCRRNALDTTGKSTGVQCAPHIGGVNVTLQTGVPYTFAMEMIFQNVSGATWEVSMFDPTSRRTISVGSIFFVDSPMGLPVGSCRSFGSKQNPPTVGMNSYTFMEYYSGGDFLTAATWSEYTHYGLDMKQYPAVDTLADCCYRGSYGGADIRNETSSTCVPPECDGVEVRFANGRYVPISKSMLKANPKCLLPPASEDDVRPAVVEDCWKDGRTPNSLDECFGRLASTSLPSVGVAGAFVV